MMNATRLASQERLFNDFLVSYHIMMAERASQSDDTDDEDMTDEEAEAPLEDGDTGTDQQAQDDAPATPQAVEMQEAVDEALSLFDAPDGDEQEIDSEDKPKRERQTTIIQDFGKKIGGARKDMYALYRQALADCEQIESPESLKQAWPEPKYLKLLASDVPSWKVSAIRALRDSLTNKPVRGYYWNEWREAVAAKRAIALGILRDEYTEESFIHQLKVLQAGAVAWEVEHHYDIDEYNTFDSYSDAMYRFDSYTRVYSLYGMYEAIGHANDLSEYFLMTNKKAQFTNHSYWQADKDKYWLFKQFKRGENSYDKKADGTERFWQHRYMNWSNGRRFSQHKYGVLANNVSKEEMYGALAADVAEFGKNKQAGKGTKRDNTPEHGVSYHNGEYYIYAYDVKARITLKDGFKSYEEAESYLTAHRDALLADFKEITKCPFERNAENAPRTSRDETVQKDVTPEEYSKTFGFYPETNGVEFGNWVEGKRRQEDLNQSTQALKDLAKVLNVPETALTLNSTLSLRFGSNGRGGANAAMAHYEPLRKAINLTKKKGAGCLAHEWFHALDNYLSGPDPTTYLSRIAEGNYIYNDIRHELFDSMKALCKTIKENRAFMSRCYALDKHRKKPYWSTTIEIMARCFEAYVKYKLENEGIRNDYLVNIKLQEDWDKEAHNTFPYPYPTKKEMPEIVKAFDNFFAEVKYETKEGEHTRTRLYSCDDYETVAGRTALADIIKFGDLTAEEKQLYEFSRDAMGLDVRFVTGDEALHGLYDEEKNTIYLNRESNTDMSWTLMHEAFHVLRHEDKDLYRDLLLHVESAEDFSQEQMDAYREKHRAYNLSDEVVKEEMLADAFANAKTQAHTLYEMTEKDVTLATRAMRFLKRTAHKAVAFFTNKASGKDTLSAKQAEAFSERLDYLTENLTVYGRRPLSQADQILGIGNLPIVPTNKVPVCRLTPFRGRAEDIRAFDLHMAGEFLKKYPAKLIAETLARESERGREEGYVADVMREATAQHLALAH